MGDYHKAYKGARSLLLWGLLKAGILERLVETPISLGSPAKALQATKKNPLKSLDLWLLKPNPPHLSRASTPTMLYLLTPLYLGSSPDPIMGTTKDSCRYLELLLTLYLEGITVGGGG